MALFLALPAVTESPSLPYARRLRKAQQPGSLPVFSASMPDLSAPSANSLLASYIGQVRVRVGGLLLHDGGLLLAAHQGLLPEGSTFWSPPGGGWQFGESLHEALVREFEEETGLAVRVGRFLHLYEFRRDGLQALELFFEVVPTDGAAPVPRLGHDPEHSADAQLLAGLAWFTPRQLLALPPAQVHPVLRGLLSIDDVFVPQLRFEG